MNKQEITSVFALITLALMPAFLYLLSLKLSNVLFGTESFGLAGDFIMGIVASVLLLVVTFILDAVFHRLKITGIKEAVMTLGVVFLTTCAFTFLIYQYEKQAALTSLSFTFLSLTYAYMVKTRYEKLSASDEKT